LGKARTNIFLADKDFNIFYANDVAQETLKTIASDIRKEFNVDTNDIIGGSIHRFHKDPGRIEKILQNPHALPHEAEFSFGKITLKASINASYDSRGVVESYVVNWEDVTTCLTSAQSGPKELKS
jgi:methyl-accepting chemotaxis protein